MNEIFNIESSKLNFRVAKMNAIEALAFRNMIADTESFDKYVTFFDTILEKIEVEVNGQWLPVKEKNRNIYYPSGIEDDYQAIQELVAYFINTFLKAVFTKSSASTQP